MRQGGPHVVAKTKTPAPVDESRKKHPVMNVSHIGTYVVQYICADCL